SAQSKLTNAAISTLSFDFNSYYSIHFLCFKPSGRERRNPYSRVLEGHHLSIRPTPRADRARKSPPIVESIGWPVRNATRPVFHKGNSLIKKNNPKEIDGLWKMPQLWKSAKQSVAFGTIFLMRIPTAAWKSLAQSLGF